MKVTNKAIQVSNFRGVYDFTIPKGTRVTSHTSLGYDESYNFVDDLSFIPKEQHGLRHDLTYYGYNVSSDDVDEVTI